MAPRERLSDESNDRRVTARGGWRWRGAYAWRWACLTCLAIAWLSSGAFEARGETGGSVRLPSMPSKKPSGWQLKLDAKWVEGFGYRPVRVELGTSGNVPVTRHRTVTIMLTEKEGYDRGHQTATVDLEVAEGTTGATTTLLLPESQEHNFYDIECFEDGERIQDISTRVSTAVSGQRTESAPNVLFLSASLADENSTTSQPTDSMKPWRPNLTECLRSLNAMGGNQTLDVPYWGRDSNDEAVNWLKLQTFLTHSPRHLLRRPEDLPDDWLALTSLDIVFTTRSDIEWLAKNRPQKLAALRAWVAAGATLCICDGGEKFDKLASIEQALDLPPSRERPRLGTTSDWRLPDPQLYDGRVVPLVSDDGSSRTFVRTANGIQVVVSPPYNNRPAAKSSSDGESDSKPTRRTPDDPEWFAMRPLGLGRVVLFRAADPFPGKERDWAWLIQSIGPQNLRWFERHGMSRWRSNPDFTNFMIRGVGEAPVFTFLFLISAFAVIIGPANYFWLRRNRRLYLLPATVLLGAGSVTATLLIYALVADGFHVRTRVRSITAVDGLNGTSVSWSRQSYYAGLAPSEGMVFPKDAAVFLISPNVDARSPDRMTQWDDKQRLTSGFLPARAVTQFLVMKSGTSAGSLDVEPAREGDAPRHVVNRLGTRIKYLAVRDEKGDFWEAQNVEPGARAALSSTNPASANANFLAANPPLVQQWYPSGYIVRYNSDIGLPSPQTLSSRLEQSLNDCGTNLQNAPVRSFAALVADPVDVPLGIEGTRMDRDLNVVIGSWREAKP